MTITQDKVVALIPAFNEERTVGPVVDAIRALPVIAEVVVIADGCSDETARVAAEHGARVVELRENIGKAGAIKAGLDTTDATIIVTIDADLIGLLPSHVDSLLTPVLTREAAMTVGLFDGGRVATELAQIVTPYLSGQRAMRRELLDGITDLKDLRFGIEVALTKQANLTNARTIEVLLPGVSQVLKEEKRGFMKGFAARMRMYRDIVKYVVKN
ncbi:MAG: glycosyltransferase family 2 protein [Chloroflexota bacterium]